MRYYIEPVVIDLAGRRPYLRETKNGSLRVLAMNDLAAMVIESLVPGAPSDVVLAGVDWQKLSVYTRRLFETLGIRRIFSLIETHGSIVAGDARG
jgi:acetyl-CoA acetyltransferase